MRIQDTDLLAYQNCPLGTFDRTVSPIETCGRELVRWHALEIFNGRIVPLPILRRKFTHLWNSRWPENATRDGDAYWNGPRAGNALAAVLFQLFDKYTVMRPFQAYDLPVGGHVLTGEYAIMARRKPDPRVQDGPYVLSPEAYRPITFTRPDLAALARWKHATMLGEYDHLGIYHLPLLRGQYWRSIRIVEPLVLPWLAAVTGAIAAGGRYPTPSGYCDRCLQKDCMKVFV